MTDRSAIEWTQATWNPVTGCDRISPGCQHCYALTLAKRLKAMGQPKYQADGHPPTSGPGFGVALHPQTLSEPLRWRRPRRIFVCSMADLFHARVPDDFIARVFATMAATPQHTYQVLTKRPGRMARLLGSDAFAQAVFDHSAAAHGATSLTWPLPNLWLGTSVEDQQRANQRIRSLLAVAAVTRFLSCEPLLGPIDLGLAICQQTAPTYGRGLTRTTVHLTGCCQRALRDAELHWIIAGGESGPSHRPVDPAWVRSLRDQALAGKVAFFFKQWGGLTSGAGGRLLDGCSWDQYPTTWAAAPGSGREDAAR
jgi:protein gp37